MAKKYDKLPKSIINTCFAKCDLNTVFSKSHALTGKIARSI